MTGPICRMIGESFFAGSARDLKRDQLGTYARALRDHGGRPVRMRLGPPKVGFEIDAVFRPEDAHQILITDSACYRKEHPGMGALRLIFGNGLVLSEGDRWRRDRRVLAPLFSTKRTMSHVDEMATGAERLVAAWGAAEGGMVDLKTAGMDYALDVLGRTVFGCDVESAAPILRRAFPVLNAYAVRVVVSPARLPMWVPTAANRRAARARRELWGVVDRLIADWRAGPLEGDDLLTRLLTARDTEDGTALDDEEVRDQTLAFLMTGHETVASTTALTLQLLGCHPDVQQRVRDEVAMVLGDHPVVADDLERLTYTSQVIDETLRLYPVVPRIIRRAHRPATVDDQEVPCGHWVGVSTWGIHHNPDVWPDPERFDPDRFGHDVGRYDHIPFGVGRRACIGQQIATAELVVAVATLIRAFQLESVPGQVPLDVGIALRPRDALPCRVTPIIGSTRPSGESGL